MVQSDSRVDAYISNAADFAKPILEHLREVVAAAVPEATETIKWGMPFWEYKGMLSGMSAFKEHCAFVLVNADQIPEMRSLLDVPDTDAMGHLGRITSLGGLPSDEKLTEALQIIARHNEAKKSRPRSAAPKAPPAAREVPDYLTEALAANPAAAERFEAFPPGRRNEYIDWFEDAKTDATRARRLEQGLAWIAEGKSRNWKYEK